MNRKERTNDGPVVAEFIAARDCLEAMMFSSVRAAAVIAALTFLTVTVLTSLADDRPARPDETLRPRTQSGETRAGSPMSAVFR